MLTNNLKKHTSKQENIIIVFILVVFRIPSQLCTICTYLINPDEPSISLCVLSLLNILSIVISKYIYKYINIYIYIYIYINAY